MHETFENDQIGSTQIIRKKSSFENDGNANVTESKKILAIAMYILHQMSYLYRVWHSIRYMNMQYNTV
jgi:hypothetical protein